MWRLLIERFRWLDPGHPIAVREAKRTRQPLPPFIRKLTDPWTMLGYAALLHGIFFVVSLVSYSRLNKLFPNMMLPFLTPFGTPVSAAILHSILYWAMLIGICNYTTYLVGVDIEGGTWRLLRTTPYSTGELLLVKMAAVGRVWGRVLRMLIFSRILALLLIPISAMMQRTNDNYSQVGLDMVGGLVFIVQPLVDAGLVACLSVLAGVLIRGTSWAKIGAYALSALTLGTLGWAGSLYLIFKSPLGAVAGVLAPLSHWAPLVSALTPPSSPAELVARTVVVLLAYLILPLVVGVVTLMAAARLARLQY